MDSKYNLKWEEYQSNLQSCYSQLEKTNHFSDVTLVGEGGDQIKAHRVILAATSPIFEDILIKNDHPKPLIYMRGVKSSHLKLLISYIYHGEVEVSTDDFKDFLAVAAELGVKGLTTDDTSDISMEKKNNHNRYEKQQNLPEHTVQHTTTKQDEYQKKLKLKLEEHYDSSYSEETQDLGTQLDSKANDLMKVETTYSCGLCGKLSITKHGLVKHKSRYHSVKKTADFECTACGRNSISKKGLDRHNTRYHSTDDTSNTSIEKKNNQNVDEKPQDHFTLPAITTITKMDEIHPQPDVLVKLEEHNDASYNC